MAQAVLNKKVRFIPCRTICKIRKDEMFWETEKQKRWLFDDLIQKHPGDSMAHLDKPVMNEYEPYFDGSKPASVQLHEYNDPVNTGGTTAY